MSTAFVPAVKTRTGHWGWDEHRYFGHGVFAELTGKQSLAGMLALSVTGRTLPPDCIGLIDDIAGAVTLADPRVWPLKLTRLIASYGSTMPAVAAGLLMEEEARIGPWACVQAAQMLQQLHAAIGANLENPLCVSDAVEAQMRTRAFVWGFGTPFRPYDERLVSLREHVKKRGRDQLPYYRIMTAAADIVRDARGVEPNLGIALAALFLDMGMNPQQIGAIVSALMQHMFLAQAVEGASQPHEGLKKLPDEALDYVGRAPRMSPRAERAARGSVRPAAASEPPPPRSHALGELGVM